VHKALSQFEDAHRASSELWPQLFRPKIAGKSSKTAKNNQWISSEFVKDFDL
jgi:hypothetical protein